MGETQRAAEALSCNKTEQLKVGTVSIWQLPGQTAFFFVAKMEIDVDGAPRAYHPEPDSNLGLDFLANAGSPGNWYGIVTDNGKRNGNPIIQGPDDPAPGFYVSATSLVDQTKLDSDPTKYVDATQIPYIALPTVVRDNLGVQLGDFAVVVNSKNGKTCNAIFADSGPPGKIGEGSVALADALNIPSSPRNGGTDSGVAYVVFPGSGAGQGTLRTKDEINTEAGRLFTEMGGLAQLQVCFPDLFHLPTVTGISPTEGPAAGNTTVTVTGANFTGATGVFFGSVAASSFTVDSDTQITAVSPAASLSGATDITITTPRGTSPTGSTDQFNYITATPPSVTDINPTSGPATGGTAVTITGTAFTGFTDVGFGQASAASVTFDSDTQLTAISPSGSGTVDVTVTTPAGTSTVTSSSGQFTYIAVPTVTGINPKSGPETGNTSVTLTGTGFTDFTGVSFGQTGSASVAFDSDTQLTAVSPPGNGTVDVTVITPGGTSSTSSTDQFTYLAATPPTVTGINPANGPAAGDTTVIITGTGFSGATDVSFGTTAASNFNVDSDTQISAISPAANQSGTVDVTVTTPNGTSSTTSADQFIYM